MPAAVMGPPAPSHVSAPLPLLQKGEPVDWWFLFKLNAGTFPGCVGDTLKDPVGATFAQVYNGS
jgi:hypothetical protein